MVRAARHRRLFLAALAVAGSVAALAGVLWHGRLPATVLPEERIEVAGQTRTYRLVIPHHLARPAPVLFVFHGAIDTTEETARWTQLDRLAADKGCLVVYPQGRLLSWPGAIPQENPGYVEPDLRFFDALCEELVARRGADPRRIYVAGMSQGAAFVHLLVARRSERIAAAAAHSGWLPDPLGDAPLATKHPCPILFIAGADDRQVPPETVREARDAFARAGHPTRFLVFPGLGHRWAGDHRINERIWAFLEPHRLP